MKLISINSKLKVKMKIPHASVDSKMKIIYGGMESEDE